MAYSKAVLDHYDNPRNVGSLDKTKDNVGTGYHRFLNMSKKRLDTSYFI